MSYVIVSDWLTLWCMSPRDCFWLHKTSTLVFYKQITGADEINEKLFSSTSTSQFTDFMIISYNFQEFLRCFTYVNSRYNEPRLKSINLINFYQLSWSIKINLNDLQFKLNELTSISKLGIGSFRVYLPIKWKSNKLWSYSYSHLMIVAKFLGYLN